MRKIVGVVFVLAMAAYLQFGQITTTVNYPVTTHYGDLPAHFVNQKIAYHVPGVVRFAGADFFRPEGYFTQAITKPSGNRAGHSTKALVKAMAINTTTKMNIQKAKLLGLEPTFSFWEEKGKWILLFGIFCTLGFLFWR